MSNIQLLFTLFRALSYGTFGLQIGYQLSELLYNQGS